MTRMRRLRNAVYFFWQRRLRGFDDRELWGLDTTIAKFALPRLRRFRKRYSHTGHPPLITPEEWQRVLSEMEWFLELHALDEGTSGLTHEEIARYDAASRLFGKYFGHLWD